MSFELSPEQEQMRGLVRELLVEQGQPRASYDGGPACDTAVWAQLAALGLVGVDVPEELGGSGGGFMDATLVAEQVGFAAAAIPYVTAGAAARVLTALSASDDAPGRLLLGELVGGARRVLLGVSASHGLELGLLARDSGAGWQVDGSVADLLQAASAEVLVAPAATERGIGWFAIDLAELEVTDQPALDPAQRPAAISLAQAPATLLGEAEEAGIELATWTVWILLAAEATGAAQHALDLTTAHAQQRHQFGEPIGRFQAVKHTLADMLVDLENARSAAYNGALALADDRPDLRQAVRLAKAVATENAVRVAQSALQLHGGIGFTWEYDLHLLLRRAKTAELVLGQPDDHFDRIAEGLFAATSGAQTGSAATSLDTIVRAAGDREFHAELSAWLDENLPEGWESGEFRLPRDPEERRAFLRQWQRQMADDGWVGIFWPEEYGGRSATLAQQISYHVELTGRRVPPLIGHRGISMVAPAIIQHGTDTQRERFVERIRTAEDLWATGFSEPEAGSDLAGLRTRGEVFDDHVLVNGQKIWTSGAHYCDWIYLLVRTDPHAPKHEGISVLLVPLDTPGITARPIRQITGGAEFNEVFFEDVVVPRENVLGPINRGWHVNRTTMSHEHFTNFIPNQIRYVRTLERLVELAGRTSPTGKPRTEDPMLRNRIARAWGVSQLLLVNGLRNVAKVEAGGEPGPEGSIMKVFGNEAEKRLFELAIDLVGPTGILDRGAVDAPERGRWQYGYLAARAATIGGGTSEVHRSKVAETVLGMPRDPWASQPEA